jgi:ADP-heptose:LPS heptosyltransferase
MWPVDNYPALADYFRQKDYEVVFTGDSRDTSVVDRIISAMKFSAVNTCGKLSLGGLAALLSKAAVVIGADTGPLHLARAVNAPTAGIYWAPNLVNWGPVTRGRHRPVVSWNMHCPICGEVPNDPMPFEPQHHCRHEVSFTHDVSVEKVVAAAEEILQFEKQQSFLTQTVFA